MRSLIQSTPAYQLWADITSSRYGHNLRLISFVPTARRPHEQVKFTASLCSAELRQLRALIDQVLNAAEDQDLVRPCAPLANRENLEAVNGQ